jgi:hypothetical protein
MWSWVTTRSPSVDWGNLVLALFKDPPEIRAQLRGEELRANRRNSALLAHAQRDIAERVCLDAVGVAAAPERAAGEQECQHDTAQRDGTAQIKGEFQIMESRLQPKLHLLETE